MTDPTPHDLCSDCVSLHLDDFLLDATSGDVNLPFGASREPALHVFAKHGHLLAVQQLHRLHASLDLNKTNTAGVTPLHIALNGGHLPLARYLIQQSARCDVNTVTTRSSPLNEFDSLDCGASALHTAIQVRRNLVAGCLHWEHATAAEYLAVIRALCEAKGADCNVRTAHGRTAAHYAVLHGDQEDVIEILQRHHCDLELVDQKLQTPLICAVTYSKIKSCRALIQAGANVNVTLEGMTALHMLIDKETNSAVNYDTAELLVTSGCDINATDSFGDTALHIAVANENMAAASWLLQHGAACGLQVNEPAKASLQDVIETEYPELSSLLVARLGDGGSLQDIPHTEGYTPIHQVTFIESEDTAVKMIDVFLDHDVTVDTRSENGKTCLMLAVAQQKLTLAKHLINCGADVNTRDSKGWNVLHIASKKFKVSKQTTSFYKYLMDASDDINALTSKRCSPLHLAVESGHMTHARLLLDAGALYRLENDCTERPLELAIVNADLAMCTLLTQAGDVIDAELSSVYSSELVQLESELMVSDNQRALYVLLSSGYRLHIESLLEHLDLEAELASAEMVLRFTQEPLALKRQAANVIRSALVPNARVGIGLLALPPGAKHILKSYITIENDM